MATRDLEPLQASSIRPPSGRICQERAPSIVVGETLVTVLGNLVDDPDPRVHPEAPKSPRSPSHPSRARPMGPARQLTGAIPAPHHGRMREQYLDPGQGVLPL
ncbi:hypothetical protein GCM10010343_17520 [Streptomyces avidinii]|nr:hypothetical protein GCM10010343_17520 [Streptomyces avidinii]